MKKLIFSVLTLAVALCGSMSSKADPVDAATARKVATNFLSQKSGHPVDLVDVTSQMPYRHIYFFVEPNGNGNVILSADDRAIPVLGYSTNTTFDPADLPAHIDLWFRHYDEELAYIIANDLEATDEISDEWYRLIKGLPEPAERAREKSVSPLLTTTWGQGSNSNRTYNYKCPDSSGYKPYAGCTAVATAQVMKYWNHPTTGRGSHSYTPTFTRTSVSANFGNTTYDWSNMPNSLSSSSSTTQRDAIATLMFHIGVATEMDYGTSGSGAATVNYGSLRYPSAENALVTYFKYSSSTHSVAKSDFTTAEWKALLKAELDASTPRPILYSGYDNSAGHSFVLDGYDNAGKFHVNWGWSSRYDNYYEMGALNPGIGGSGGNTSGTYNYRNQAVIGIKPISNTGTTNTVTANASNSSWGSVTGARSYSDYDTVTLIANANEGYRFAGWSDGNISNPRQFIVNDNVSFTAKLERISGDTLRHFKSYSVGSSWGVNGGTFYWGVRFPASALTAHRKISKVYFYAPRTGTYTLSVYNGGTTPNAGTRLLSGAGVNVTSTGYVDVNINANNIAFDATKPLWIVLSSSISYPATTTTYSGNNDSRYRSTNGTSWSALNSYGSWMIEIENAYYSGNPVAITEAYIEDGYTISNGKGYITVTGVENETVRLIDNGGRVIATDNGSSDVKEFVAPASGVYLIQVGNKPARKIVVKK